MKSLRLAASTVIRNAAYYVGVSGLLTRAQREPRILMLHGVGTPESPSETFRAQLSFLVRLFRIVPLAKIWEPDDSHGDPRPKLALTFDDGLRNNFTVAYEILREYQAPATFYVCPGLIESGRWLWTHECRARLARLSSAERERFALGLGVACAEIEAITQKMKNMRSDERVLVEVELRKRTPGFIPTQEESRRFDVMSWNELKSIEESLVSIGGHSMNHEILPQLDNECLENEVAGCKRSLERELGRPVLHFCYPDGAYNAAVVSSVGRHFTSAVTTKTGCVPTPPLLLELPRIAMPVNVPDLAWRMQRPTN